MSLKPKTSRRLALAGVLLVLAVTAVVGLVFVRQWQKDRFARTSRSEGMAHYEKREYALAAGKLRHSLARTLSDAEAWRAFGDCLEHDEQPDLRNLRSAIEAYSRVYDLEPSDRVSAQKLLSLYNRLGLFQEAQTHAARLRPARVVDAGPEHFEVLREEAAARVGLKQFDDRLGEIADRLIALRPDDFNANLTKAAYLRENKRGAEALSLVTAAAAKFPENRPLRLLKALIETQESGSPDAAALMTTACDAAGIDPKTGTLTGAPGVREPDQVFRLVSLFDSVSRFGYSESLLRGASASADADTDVHRLSVRRTWQAGRHSDVVARLGDIDISPTGAHSDLLAFKALALRDLGRAAEAKPIVKAMSERSDFRARTWSVAFEIDTAFNDTAVPAAEAVRKIRAAQKDVPVEPVLSVMLGQTLAGLGRTDEAHEAWRTAASTAPGWSLPHVESARALLDEGRADAALRAAELGLLANPTGLAANVAFLNAQAAVIDQSPTAPTDLAEMSKRFDEAERQAEAIADANARRSLLSSIVPARVIVAVRSGNAEAARSIIRKAIAAPGEPDAATLRRLAVISAREKLGVESECLDRAEQGKEPGASATLARALTLNEAGRAADGLALLKKGAAAAGTADRADWERAVAQFLDGANDPGALDAWKQLADASPTDLSVQLAALRARSSARDLAFVDRLTERVQRLSNADEGRPLASARVARARALLSGTPSVRARDEAVSILRALSLEASDGFEVRSLLVAALMWEAPEQGVKPDLAGAIEQLRAVRDSAPDRATVSLQIGAILQRQREFERARDEFARVAVAPDVPAEVRQRAIDLLIAQADFSGAVTPFRALLESQGDRAEPARWLKLATVYRALRQDSQALAIYRRLASAPIDDPEQIAQIADGLALDGQRTEAERVLARLDALTLEPGRKDMILGTFWERRAEPERATVYYERMIADAPDRAESWSRYAQFCVARSEFDKAQDLISRGLARVPGSAELKVVQQQIAVRRSDRPDVNMADLVSAMEADPAYKGKADVIRAVEELRRDGRLESPQGIAEMRARFPGELAVQTLGVRLLARLTPPRFDLAIAAARETMAAFPTAPEPARLAAAIFREGSEWPEMLRAAQAWQQLARTPEADLTVAEAQINLNQLRSALDGIRPHFEAALKAPGTTRSDAALGLYCRALVASGKPGEALEIVRPLLKDSPLLRSRVVIPIALLHVSPESESATWLQTVEPLIPEDDADGRIMLASGWSTLAGRSKPVRDDWFERALAAVRPLTLKPGPGVAAAHETIGSILRQRQDTTGAAESYRRALAADPQRMSAMLGLADLLVATGGEPSEAVTVAERATAAAGSRDLPSQRALARALDYQAVRLGAAGKTAESRAAHQRAADVYRSIVAIDESDAIALVGLAQSADAIGDIPAAVAAYERALGIKGMTPQERAGVQNNLAYAMLRAPRTTGSLERARAYVMEAVTALEAGPFMDTLGAIEAARGDRAAAVKAYTRALELDRSLHGTRVELAALLATNNSGQERSRALVLLDEAIKSNTLDAEQSKRAQTLRDQISRLK